jgi:hypothetical protein
MKRKTRRWEFMQEGLTWRDAEAYFQAELRRRETELSAEKKSLVEEDLARGDESLIRRYINLRLQIKSRYRDYFESQPIEEQLKKLGNVKQGLPPPNPEKSFDIPVEARIEEMIELSSELEARIKNGQKNDDRPERRLDSFVHRHYDRKKAEDQDRSR